MTISLQDPTNGKWSTWASEPDFNRGNYFSWLIKNQIEITPGHWEHLNVRITFSKAAHMGSWTLVPHPVQAYSVVRRNGVAFDAFLNEKATSTSFTVK